MQGVLPGMRQRPQPFDLVEHELRLAKEAAAVHLRQDPASANMSVDRH
jgi:hypothetical protein